MQLGAAQRPLFAQGELAAVLPQQALAQRALDRQIWL